MNITNRFNKNVIFTLLKKCFNFSGRAARLEFWMWYVSSFIVLISFFVLLELDYFRVFLLIFIILSFIPLSALLVIRLHDIDISGWYILFIIIIFILNNVLEFPTENQQFGIKVISNIVYLWFLYWLCKKGNKNANRFGIPCNDKSSKNSKTN